MGLCGVLSFVEFYGDFLDFAKFCGFSLTFPGKCVIIAVDGSVAQLVEQRPEEPCVVGSSPTGTTILEVDFR